jgi:hypothetical protein
LQFWTPWTISYTRHRFQSLFIFQMSYGVSAHFRKETVFSAHMFVKLTVASGTVPWSFVQNCTEI